MKRSGVVVVHGMGHPRPEVMLRSVVEPLAAWLRVFASQQPDRPDTEIVRETGTDGRAYLRLRHGTREWLFTEAFWAPLVQAPPFAQTLRWAAAHFFHHLARLIKDAVIRSLIPSIVGAALVAASVAYTLALLPILLLIAPVMPLVLGLLLRIMERLYRFFIRITPQRDIASNSAFLQAIATWRRTGPTALATSAFVILAAAAWIAGAAALPSGGARIAVIYGCVAAALVVHKLANGLAVDPDFNGMPVTVLSAIGVTLSKYGFLSARLTPKPVPVIYRDTLHNIAASPATAVTTAIERWLRANDEWSLLNYVRWDRYMRRTKSRLVTGTVLLLLIAFRLVNAVTAILLYICGAVALFPVALMIWALSAAGSVPVIRFVFFLKDQLDGLLLGSVGDIDLFMHNPEQASRVRHEIEQAIDAVALSCDEVCVIAHSLGCAVSYDTLTQPANEARAAKVKSFVTVGGILPMVWRMTPRRPAFDAPLPGHIRWVNLWSRLDPAGCGPIAPERILQAKPNLTPKDLTRPQGTVLSVPPLAAPEPATFEEIVVSNADDIFLDHTGYWLNSHEVVPQLLREIWSEADGQVTDHFQRHEAVRAFRRRVQILCVSGPKLLTWYTLPAFVLLSGGPSITSFLDGVVAMLAAHSICWAARWSIWEQYLAPRPGFGVVVPRIAEDELKATGESGTMTVLGYGVGRTGRD